MSTAVSATNPSVRIFLSYATEDEALALSLRAQFTRGDIRCFYAPLDIRSQEFWEPRLEEEIVEANIVLLLFTEAAGRSKWVQWEFDAAARAGISTWIVMDRTAAKVEATEGFFHGRNVLRRQQYNFDRAECSVCFATVVNDIDERFPPVTGRYRGIIEVGNNPYPGPRTFEEDDEKHPFFGRGKTTNQLLRALDGLAPTQILLVSGPSGAGKSSLLRVGLKKALQDCFYPSPIEAGPETKESDLLRSLLSRVRGVASETIAPLSPENLIAEIGAAIQKAPQSQFVFCFDQMENFLSRLVAPQPAGPGQTTEVDSETRKFFTALERILEQREHKHITFLISFRKEYLLEVQTAVDERFPRDNSRRQAVSWGQVVVYKMSRDEARESIIGPCEQRDVFFDREFADLLLDALADDEQGGDPTFNPMDIQKICERLWNDISALDFHNSINLAALEAIEGVPHPNGKKEQHELAGKFVNRVLSDYLNEKICGIAAGMNKPEVYIWLALDVFIGPGNTRVRVDIEEIEIKNADGSIGTQQCVGELELREVRELENGNLVQRSGRKRYELVHDSLAEEIAEKGSVIQGLVAMKSLHSEMRRQQREDGRPVFNQHPELLEQLEEVRATTWKFAPQEAAFVFAAALGDKRITALKKPIAPDHWVTSVKPAEMVSILKDGLLSEESVQLDVLALLLKPAVRTHAGEEIARLETELAKLALAGRSGEIKAGACAALVALNRELGINAVFSAYRNSKAQADARLAVALIRDGVDRLGITPNAYVSQWKKISGAARIGILTTLCRWRFGQALTWLFLILAATAPFTALGAILPFIPLGAMGASLTMEGTRYGAMAGIFHGATGGFIWGIGVTIGLLIYSVIWRGGRIRPGLSRETVGLSLFAMVGATLGGLGNTAVITYVFEETGLYKAGWLNQLGGDRSYQVFFVTLHGWITPIFGAVLGLGIGWTMAHILGDPKESWIAKDQNGEPLLATGHFRKPFLRITAEVFKNSWRSVIWLAIGALVLIAILVPGDGVCDPVAHADYQCSVNGPAQNLPAGLTPSKHVLYDKRVVPEGCVVKETGVAYLLPNIYWRSFGLAAIIYGGSVFQEIAFLFSLLVLQFGSDLQRNMKENRWFLRSARAVQSV